jgi:hypothetical protein
VGRERSTAEGAVAARQCGLLMLSILRDELGSLDYAAHGAPAFPTSHRTSCTFIRARTTNCRSKK